MVSLALFFGDRKVNYMKTPFPKIEMKTLKYEIHEQKDGWMVTPPKKLFDTAAQALKWIKKSQKENSVAILEWYPVSKVGRLVVKTLTSS